MNSQCREHSFIMLVHANAWKNFYDEAVFIDNECRAHDAPKPVPEHLFLLPHAVGVANGSVNVTQQRKIQMKFFFELDVRGHRIGADTQNDGTALQDGAQPIAKCACFLRARRCIVFGIKKEHDALAAKIRETHKLAFVVGQSKIGSGLADL